MDYDITYRYQISSDKTRGSVGGFTLIEVLVALAILTITLTGIYRLHAQTMLMSTRARFDNLAPALAQGKLAEVERQGIQNSTDGSGEFGPDFSGYSWTVRIEDLPSDLLKEQNYHLARIEVTITQNEEASYKLRTYRFYTAE